MATMTENTVPKPAWCPGCGNFGILTAVKKALSDAGIPPWRVLMVSGIGQAGKLPQYMKCNHLNELHGRAVPAAVGAKIANHELVVVAEGGDGDGYGEGGNHWLHAMRRNHHVTYLVHNNQVYGLTKGQASPTSDDGFVTKTTPDGARNPIHPLAIAIAAGCTFVARGFAGNSDHLARIIVEALHHKGFALVDILQPCVSFNHLNTFAWYRERVYKLEEDRDYDPADTAAAFAKASEWGSRIPIGILFRTSSPTFEDRLAVLGKGPLVSQTTDSRPVAARLLEEFA